MATKQESVGTKQARERQESTPSARSRPMTRGEERRGRRERDGRRGGEVKGLGEAKLARGLGWFSIGLGLAQVVAPQSVARLIGVRGDHRSLFRLLGMRELASGIGLLAQPNGPHAGWMWSRVGGDAMDLALLGSALSSDRSNRGRLAAATAAVTGVTALDLLCSQRLSQRSSSTTQSGAIRVEKAITINRSPEELYNFWRDFQNLPRFMKHLESVRVTGEGRSHWVAKGPAGTTVEWDAETYQDRPNELIAWRSLEDADVDHAGSVRFDRAPGDRGTIVRVKLNYSPPAGVIGATVAKLFGEDPEWQIKDDLRRFKQVIETGEIITTEGQPAGRPSSTSWRYDTAVRS